MAPGGPTSTTVPWWAHALIGGVVLAAGAGLYALGAQTFGEGLIIAAVAFLGVGSGVAASA